jgi:diphthamide synthase (EF-2-diphthine--ammonia ligase)
LDDQAIADLRLVRERTGLDLCGEEGEYHTLVADGPQFGQSIQMRSFSVGTTDSMAFMQIHQPALAPK